MLRRTLMSRAQSGEEHFRWRGGDVSRLEGLTDAVFAVSLTLLIVSFQVPNTFDELRAAFIQLPVFLVCFAVLYMVWHAHFQFHRRYGLEDKVTILLNAALLFLVLFYVYPLKFLFTALYTSILHGSAVHLDAVGNPVGPSVQGEQMADLMIMYGAGFAGIFVVLGLCVWRAWAKREALELDAYEGAMTRWKIYGHAIMASFGLMAVVVTLINPRWAPIAGLLFFLIGPAMGWHGWKAANVAERARAAATVEP